MGDGGAAQKASFAFQKKQLDLQRSLIQEQSQADKRTRQTQAGLKSAEQLKRNTQNGTKNTRQTLITGSQGIQPSTIVGGNSAVASTPPNSGTNPLLGG